MMQFFEEYAKHTVLNFGQVMHGLRYIYSHPDFDSIAARGTPKHFLLSLALRLKRLANDIFFTIIPPHWHHTADDLRAMQSVPLKRWFFYGYAAWKFTEDGDLRTDVSMADPRWDPRCRGSLERR